MEISLDWAYLPQLEDQPALATMLDREPGGSYTRRSSDDRLLSDGRSEDEEFFPDVDHRTAGSVDFASVGICVLSHSASLCCSRFSIADAKLAIKMDSGTCWHSLHRRA